jgi:AcrR family transcriptional regulator
MRPQKKVVKTNGKQNNDGTKLRQIYNAAAKIICDKGFDAMTMNDIAQAVGMTKAGVYHYIDGKKDMLFAVMSFGMDSLDRAVIEPARVIADPEQRLRTIVYNHSQLITKGSNPITIVVDEMAGLSAAHRRKINQRKRVYFDLIRDTLNQLKEDGKLRDVDTTVAAFSILGMMLWISRWYHPDGKLDNEAVSAEILKLALGSVMLPESRSTKTL